MLSNPTTTNSSDNIIVVVGDKRYGPTSYHGKPSNNPFEAESSRLGLSNGVARFGRSVQLEFNKSLCNYGRLVKLEKFNGTKKDDVDLDRDPDLDAETTHNHPLETSNYNKSSYEMAHLERTKMDQKMKQESTKHCEKLKAERLVLLQTRERLASDGERKWSEWSSKQVAELERLERAEWWRYSLRSSSQSQLLTTSFIINDKANCHEEDIDDIKKVTVKSVVGKQQKLSSALSKEMSRNSRSRHQACQDLLRYCRSSGHLWDKKAIIDEHDYENENDDLGHNHEEDNFDEDKGEKYDEYGCNARNIDDPNRPKMTISNSAACLLQETAKIPNPMALSSDPNQSNQSNYNVIGNESSSNSNHLILPQPKVTTYLTKHALEDHMQKVAKDLVLLKKRIFSRHERLAIRQRQAAQDQQDRISKFRKRREKLRQKIEQQQQGNSGIEPKPSDDKSDLEPLQQQQQQYGNFIDFDKNDTGNMIMMNDNNDDSHGNIDNYYHHHRHHHNHDVIIDETLDELEPERKIPNPIRPKSQDRYVKALLTSISHKLANVSGGSNAAMIQNKDSSIIMSSSQLQQPASSLLQSVTTTNQQSNIIDSYKQLPVHSNNSKKSKHKSIVKTGSSNIVCPCSGPECAVNCPLGKNQKGHLELLSSLMKSLTVTRK